MDDFKELNFKTTEEIKVPTRIIDQVIGQDKAKEIIKKAAKQRRHVLLIGEPGTGKSMLGQALAELLPSTNLEDILVYPNFQDENNPKIRTVPAGQGRKIIAKERLKFSSKSNGFLPLLIIFFVINIINFIVDFFINQESSEILRAADRISSTIFFVAMLVVLAIVFFNYRMKREKQIEFFVPKLIVDNSGRKTAPFIDATGLHEGALLGDVRHDPFQCFEGKNIVYEVKNGKIIPWTIEEFVNNYLVGEYTKKEGDILIRASFIKKPIYVLGYKDGVIKPVRVLAVNKRLGNQSLINLNSNFWISVTPEHKIYTNKLNLIEADHFNTTPFYFNQIPIITEEDIVNTYNEKEIESYYQYLTWKNYENKKGWKRDAKALNIPPSRVRWWYKGSKPISYKLIEKLKETNLIPLYLSNEKLPILARILGAIFGDGSIDKRLNTLSFISSEKQVIENFIRDLKQIFGEFAYEVKEGGEKGKSYLFRTWERHIIRFFIALGAPFGNKTTVKFEFPNWVLSNPQLFLNFLDGLFSSDSPVPKFYKNWGIKLSDSIEISQITEKIDYKIKFFETIRDVLKRFGIKSRIKIIDKGNKYLIRLLISQSIESASLLYSILEFRYSPKKKKAYELALRTFLDNIEGSRVSSFKSQLIQLLNKQIKSKLKSQTNVTYNITTESGNLIVNNILVKNSGGLQTPAHQRVEAGAIHKAHKGVLFIDEIATLRPEMQVELLTAMQEKKYPITGRSERSAGAMVKTDPVPCDFILVAAGNLETIEELHPALRSRIKGYGYEIYMNDMIEDTPENRQKIARFVAQEVKKDGKIPHFTREAVIEIIKEAKKRAGRKGYLTLKLRDLGGLVRIAGDIARERNHKYVTKEDVLDAKKLAKNVEEQFVERYLKEKKEYQVIKTQGAMIGRVNGLAVFSDAETGIVLPIEAIVTPAIKEAQIIATGKLGEIAQEAIDNVSAIIKKYSGKDLRNYDIHIQFLQTYEGVEGDSASISVATAIISALENIPVKQSVAMTGSLSVLGEVLPVGGINEKIKAAIEAGLKKVIIPESNLKDVIIDTNGVEVVPVKYIWEVLDHALEGRKKKEIVNKIKRAFEKI